MGWDFAVGHTKQDAIKDCTRSWEYDGTSGKCLDYQLKNRELWSLWEYHEPNKPPRNMIVLFLLRPRADGWGRKMMDEAEHPYYYGCPLEYLDRAPVVNQKWRDKVREAHAVVALER